MTNKLTGYESYPGKIIGKITATGKSAYESWLDQGNTGTVQDFLNDLDKHHEHNQILSSEIWNINHNLDKYPSVTVVDSAETVVYGSIEYIDKNNLKIIFSAEFAGKAYLN
jgi:hypothetical protein